MTLISKKTRNQKSYIIEELHNYNILLDTREIFLHGYIDEAEDPGTDYRIAANFIKNIRLLENNGSGPIIVHQSNIGGDWSYGMMMYDMIKNADSVIIFILHGIAASMGSIIPQAADARIIMPNCLFMIHQGYTSIHPDLTIKQSSQWKRWEDEICGITLDVYVERCKDGTFFKKGDICEKEVEKYIKDKLNEKEDWILSAKDAVGFGFADGIFGQSGFDDLQTIKELYG